MPFCQSRCIKILDKNLGFKGHRLAYKDLFLSSVYCCENRTAFGSKLLYQEVNGLNIFIEVTCN